MFNAEQHALAELDKKLQECEAGSVKLNEQLCKQRADQERLQSMFERRKYNDS